MIQAYYRPKTLVEAERLLAEPGERRVPLGGGSVVSRAKDQSYAVVDLQDLGLGSIEQEGKRLEIGSMATLESMAQSSLISAELKQVLLLSASLNIRNQATIAGYLVCADGRSPLAVALLALDASTVWHPAEKRLSLGDWFTVGRAQGLFITSLQFNTNVVIKYRQVARSPMDQPIVAAAIARWESGRMRIALGGFGSKPILALDGQGAAGAAEAARSAFANAEDHWASAEFRQDVAARLVTRMIEELTG
ncbi:MAG: FAD binding domain-containing protein [Bellilinea sp.]|jgi:probable selenate reductase FAD-binding subunit